MITVQDAIDHHNKVYQGWEQVYKGRQWPDSLRQFALRCMLRERYYAQILSLAL